MSFIEITSWGLVPQVICGAISSASIDNISADKIKGKFDRKKFKDATDEEKAALRDKLRASRKEWEVAMKAHRVEVGKRMKEIREEFKNNRDKVIEGNKPGE